MNKRKLIERYQNMSARVGEIADLCKRENRNRTEAEEAEYRALTRDMEIARMQMQALDTPVNTRAALADADAIVREGRDKKFDVHVVLTRSGVNTTSVAGTGIIPVHEQEFLKPLREGLIYDKVGLKLQSGLSGELRWPTHGKATATWEDEQAELTDSSIDFSKLTMSGFRLGVAIPVTRETLTGSEGVVERVVTEEMPAACIEAINTALFKVTKIDTDKVYGPFAGLTPMQFAGAVPTRKELLAMKAKVAKTGIKFVAPCWSMTEDMKAELEDVKVDAGSGRFLCENGMIFGYPVFTTNAVAAGYVGFGDWSYQAAGFFGKTEMVIDPYTLARKFSTDFVLNMRFGTVTLRPDAFVLGKAAKTED